MARLFAVEYNPYAWTDLSKTSSRKEPVPRANAMPVTGSMSKCRPVILV